MKKMLLFCVVAVALLAAVPAHATSGLGLRGETGLVRTPMAAALPPLTLAVAMDFVSSDYVFLPLRMEFGVIEGLELGGNFWHLDSDRNSEIWGLNAKYVLPQFVENLGLAVGGHYRKQTVDGFENDGHDVYFATSYRYSFLTPTVGVRYESITGANDESDLRFFGSLVADVLPNFAVGFEIESASSKLEGTGAKAPIWFGVRFQPLEVLSVQAGMMNYADYGAEPDEWNDFIFHVGAQYAYSFGR